ncbi:MAG: Slp family lipoprotein [Deltaproteobacteria bacterium]|nr:Slp family lipoprotein [Deltaproteobacteria bacterium]
MVYYSRSRGIWWGLLLIIISLSACGPTISEEVRRQVRTDLTFPTVFNDPDSFRGQTVMFNGMILESINTPDGTLLTVLQEPVDYYGRPHDPDKSAGRFMVMDSRYLDVAVYAPGRAVSIVGVVDGSRTLPLGKTQYRYPLLKTKEIYLWKAHSTASIGLGVSSSVFDGRATDMPLTPYGWPW